MRLGSITARMIETWTMDMDAKWAYQTWHKPYSIFRLIIRYGCKNGYFTVDPTEYVDLPAKQEQHQPETWTYAQCMTFLDLIHDHPLYPMIYVHLQYGLRIGELCGLEWKFVTSKTFTVVHGIDSMGNITDLKTKTSHRTLPILEGVVFPPREGDFVFLNSHGQPYRPDAYSKTLHHLMISVGVQPIAPYNFRHTWATMNKNLPENFRAYWMGHTQQSTADRYYTDWQSVCGVSVVSLYDKSCLKVYKSGEAVNYYEH